MTHDYRGEVLIADIHIREPLIIKDLMFPCGHTSW